jgi:DNA-binding IscR family transcriptional regulator
MRIPSRFAIAVHILALLGTDADGDRTSEWMAGSIGVNPVIVRNVTGMLRRAGLVSTQQGVAGAHLAKSISEITLFDVYRAVETDPDLFSIHAQPNPACPVGANIQATLERVLGDAQRAMESRLARTKVSDVVKRLRENARR